MASFHGYTGVSRDLAFQCVQRLSIVQEKNEVIVFVV